MNVGDIPTRYPDSAPDGAVTTDRIEAFRASVTTRRVSAPTTRRRAGLGLCCGAQLPEDDLKSKKF